MYEYIYVLVADQGDHHGPDIRVERAFKTREECYQWLAAEAHGMSPQEAFYHYKQWEIKDVPFNRTEELEPLAVRRARNAQSEAEAQAQDETSSWLNQPNTQE